MLFSFLFFCILLCFMFEFSRVFCSSFSGYQSAVTKLHSHPCGSSYYFAQVQTIFSRWLLEWLVLHVLLLKAKNGVLPLWCASFRTKQVKNQTNTFGIGKVGWTEFFCYQSNHNFLLFSLLDTIAVYRVNLHQELPYGDFMSLRDTQLQFRAHTHTLLNGWFSFH